MTKKAYIKAIRSYQPLKKLTNIQIAEEFPQHDIDKIFQSTGVAYRSIAASDVCASDLGVIASDKLFAEGLCQPEEIDFLLFCTQTPDYFLPTSACLIHDRLGLKKSCGALDINLGCSGFVYSLAFAKGLIETGQAQSVLLITADVLTKVVNPQDLSARFLFSDAAAATIISGLNAAEDLIGPFVFGTDGRGGKNLIVPAGGLRRRPDEETALVNMDASGNFRSPQDIFMDGAEIFNFSLKTVPQAVRQLLAKAHRDMSDLKLIIFHQANKFLLETLRRKLKISQEKFPIMLDFFGNTSSATIPMVLEESLLQGTILPGHNLMVVGFGVGYSWAASLLKMVEVNPAHEQR